MRPSTLSSSSSVAPETAALVPSEGEPPTNELAKPVSAGAATRFTTIEMAPLHPGGFASMRMPPISESASLHFSSRPPALPFTSFAASSCFARAAA